MLIIAAAISPHAARSATAEQFSAGASRAVIAIPADALPLDGFGAVHDPLQVRVLALAVGSQRVVIAVLDQTSLSDSAVADARAAVGRATAADPANVFICASHTFSAPHLFEAAHLPPGMTLTPDDQRRGKAYHEAVMAAVARAAAAAAANMRPARIGVGLGSSDVNVNRNVPMADGWWLGANDAGPSDKDVAVVRIEALDRHPLAFLVNYAVQSAVMNQSLGADGHKGITADLGGAAVRHVEAQYGDAVALFLTGAAGDQIPKYTAQRNAYDKDGHFRMIDIGDQGYPFVDLQGERLGTEGVRVSEGVALASTPATLRVISGTASLDAQERPKNLQQLHPSKTYAFNVMGKVAAPYSIMQIGDLAVVGVQAELSAVTGQAIKQHSPFAHTIVVTMVNGAAKYMPDAEAYRRITYEAMNSPFGRGSAERFAAQITDELTRMHTNAAH